MLDELLVRVPKLRLADPDAAPEHRPANFISGLERLPVEW
jgi:cytochrome P450 family 142 subfamily A polypeptide 1